MHKFIRSVRAVFIVYNHYMFAHPRLATAVSLVQGTAFYAALYWINPVLMVLALGATVGAFIYVNTH